jgi:Na+-transporting NADH:ubiquinone oxidoreductase subunit NqrD
MTESGQNSTQPPASARRGWGWFLLIAGLLTSFITFGNMTSSGIQLVAGVMSGGVASPNGQTQANGLLTNLSAAPIFLVLGLISAVIGLVLLALKPNQRK